MLFKVKGYSLRRTYGQDISDRNAYRNSTMKPLVKRPFEKHSKRWQPHIRHCGQYSYWKWYGRPRFDSDTPRNSCLCQIFNRSVGTRPAFCRQGTGDYFPEETGWGQVQQLWHEADNSPSSHDVIKLRLNFQPLSMYFLTSFYTNKRKISCNSSLLTGKLAVRIKLLWSSLIFHISEGRFLLLFRVCCSSM